MKPVIMLALCLVFVLDAYAQKTSRIHHVSIAEFRHMMDSLRDEVVVDLRTPEELKQGKIPGAVVIDFFGPAFESSIANLNRDKVYLLYCASGGRSGETAVYMQKLGFKHIYNMEAGFSGWVKQKLPVSK